LIKSWSKYRVKLKKAKNSYNRCRKKITPSRSNPLVIQKEKSRTWKGRLFMVVDENHLQTAERRFLLSLKSILTDNKKINIFCFPNDEHNSLITMWIENKKDLEPLYSTLLSATIRFYFWKYYSVHQVKQRIEELNPKASLNQTTVMVIAHVGSNQLLFHRVSQYFYYYYYYYC
jgi:hypothetical protein